MDPEFSTHSPEVGSQERAQVKLEDLDVSSWKYLCHLLPPSRRFQSSKGKKLANCQSTKCIEGVGEQLLMV